MKRLSIRARFALWFTTTMVILLAGVAIASTLLLLSGVRSELDADLKRDLKYVSQHIERRPDGSLLLRGIHRYDGFRRDGDQRFVDILDAQGNLLISSGRPPSRRTTLPRVAPNHRANVRSFRLPDGSRVRRISTTVKIHGRTLTVHLTQSERKVWEAVNRLLIAFAVLLPMAILLAALGGWILARKVLAPVRALTALAHRIHGENLGERIEIDHPGDELGDLAQMINQMLDRIEGSFDKLRQFTADASHELRTPLATVRSLGEVAIQSDQSPAELERTVAKMVEETNRIAALLEDLLLLSRADEGRLELTRERHSLSALAQAAHDMVAVLAESKGLTLTLTRCTDDTVACDRRLFLQALINLIDNALKFTAPSGSVTVVVEKAAGADRLRCSVQDTGVGISQEDQTKIFERFYRVDESRSRSAGGTGLGLAIVKWIVEAHAGTLTVESQLGAGSTFVIELPKA